MGTALSDEIRGLLDGPILQMSVDKATGYAA